MTDDEQWRAIPGWPKYMASSHGRVRSLTTGYVMNPRINRDGYAVYRLAMGGRGARRRMREICGHTLVLLTFVGPKPSPQHQCRHHPDPTPTNNHVNNLQWGTAKENAADIPKHRRNFKRHAAPPGENHPNAKLTEAQALEILSSALPLRPMASKLGVSVKTVNDIRLGRAWRHLPRPETPPWPHRRRQAKA